MTSANGSTSPTGQRRNILLVEDELMIRMLLEDILVDLGYSIVATAGRVDEAITLAKNASIDGAILDVNLNGQTVSPVADILAARGLPFVFATGYGEHGVPDHFRDRPTLQKPFQPETVNRILSRIFQPQPA